MVLLGKLSYAIKNQLMACTIFILCLSLVLYSIRIGGFHAVKGPIRGDFHARKRSIIWRSKSWKLILDIEVDHDQPAGEWRLLIVDCLQITMNSSWTSTWTVAVSVHHTPSKTFLSSDC